MPRQRMDWPDYELIDFGADAGGGAGRKLERFGPGVFDRPCPAAQSPKQKPEAWRHFDARYNGGRVGDGRWELAPGEELLTADQQVTAPLGARGLSGAAGDRSIALEIELSPAGQVGLFPEQFANWRWIAGQVQRARRPLRVLNLFAYTGGSTLAAACAPKSVEVTHVDASKPSVALARQNAARSGLAEAPVRWIVEDAVKYCRRELKRGSRYDAVILDPPTYGHGPKGEEWRLACDLPALLELIGELTERAPAFLLATCHTPGVGPAELSAYLSDGVVGHCGAPPASGRLWLKTEEGRKIESGVYARWPR
ncbi:MAG: class I SAM-dependent methyltransferase [Planctomycetota bacterium]